MSDTGAPELRELDELIRQDKKAGLQSFRRSDFRAGLEARMKDTAAPLGFLSVLKPKLVPALLVFAAVVVGFLIVFHRSAPRTESESIFEAGLRRSSVWQGPVRREGPAQAPAGTERSKPSPFAFEVLQAVKQAQGSEPAPVLKPALPFSEGTVPGLSLLEKMEILLKERTIHRFFDRYLQNKEVSQCPEKSLPVFC